MADFIELTAPDESKLYVNPDAILYMGWSAAGSMPHTELHMVSEADKYPLRCLEEPAVILDQIALL